MLLNNSHFGVFCASLTRYSIYSWDKNSALCNNL